MLTMNEMPETSRYSFDLEEDFEWDCDLHSGEGIDFEEEEEDD